MDKGARELLRQSPEGAPRPDFASGETFVFAHQPTHQIGVHMLPDRRHRRPVKAAVILLPAREDRIEHGRKIGQFFVALQLQMPSPNGLSHGLAGRAAASVLGPVTAHDDFLARFQHFSNELRTPMLFVPRVAV